MIQEKTAMTEVVNLYFASDCPLDGLAGATPNELKHRTQVLKYGYGARTRITLFNSSKNMLELLGQEDWDRLGYQFSINIAASEPQIGLLPRLFFNWVIQQKISNELRQACERDQAMFLSQNQRYIEHLAILDPQDFLTKKIQIQDSVEVIVAQNLIVSRDRHQFYLQTLSPDLINWMVSLRKTAFYLFENLPENIEASDFANFIVISVQKKWFMIADQEDQ